MRYQIFVQSHNNNGYRASVLGIPNCAAEGATEAEAVAKAKEALSQRKKRPRKRRPNDSLHS